MTKKKKERKTQANKQKEGKKKTKKNSRVDLEWTKGAKEQKKKVKQKELWKNRKKERWSYNDEGQE